jgi:hypothetical protein
MSLFQLGIGPGLDFKVTGIDESWSELINGLTDVEGVKSYILLKTKLQFDTPPNSFTINDIEAQLDEITWRLMVAANPPVV